MIILQRRSPRLSTVDNSGSQQTESSELLYPMMLMSRGTDKLRFFAYLSARLPDRLLLQRLRQTTNHFAKEANHGRDQSGFLHIRTTFRLPACRHHEVPVDILSAFVGTVRMRITQKQNVFFSCLNQLRHCHVCRLEIIAQGAVDIFSADTAIHHKDRHLLCRFPNVLYLLGILIILCIAGTDEHQRVNSLLKNGIDGDRRSSSS